MSPRIIRFVAALVLIFTCSSARAQTSPDIPSFSDKPLVAYRSLSTNPENTIRVMGLLGQEQGIGDIQSLVTTAAVEEQWVYLPQHEVWIEIGINEGRAEVETDVDYLTKVLASSDSVDLYHFHPARHFRPGRNETVALAIPSPADVEASVRIARLQQALNPNATVRNFVVSPYGVVEYQPTAAGRMRMFAEATNPRAFIERDLLILVAVRRSAFNLNRILGESPAASPQDLIATLCTELSSEFYEMKFSRHD